jgi:hypothetical protein
MITQGVGLIRITAEANINLIRIELKEQSPLKFKSQKKLLIQEQRQNGMRHLEHKANHM